MIKYAEEMICFQEVPDEITLSFSISNCPRRCEGCHSAYLSQDIGLPLKQHLLSAIEANKGLITCVLFMGGDDEKQIDELRDCIEICHREKLKVALYTGSDEFPSQLSTSLDYIKYGHYDKSRGGLTSKNTNQKFYKKNNGEWIDITYRFWKTPKEQYED